MVRHPGRLTHPDPVRAVLIEAHCDYSGVEFPPEIEKAAAAIRAGRGVWPRDQDDPGHPASHLRLSSTLLTRAQFSAGFHGCRADSDGIRSLAWIEKVWAAEVDRLAL